MSVATGDIHDSLPDTPPPSPLVRAMLFTSGMIDDLRFAIRTLRHSPAFAISALAILAIGIGASTIVFGIIDGVVLRPLPFGERSDRLVPLHSTHPTQAQDWDD